MEAPLTIPTDRLTLTVPTHRDAKAIFDRYASDTDVTRYVGWSCHRTLDDTLAFIDFSQAEWKRSSVGPYLIRDCVQGHLLGSTGLSCAGSDEAMTGYVLAKDAWGNGYATEALLAMVRLAQELEIDSVFALCHPDHRASWRVLEKAGFLLDLEWSGKIEFPNLAPGIPQDVKCYRRSIVTEIQ